MATRERFFPAAPSSKSTANFVADPANPLHRSVSGVQESSVIAALDKLDTEGTNQSGLTRWRKLSPRVSREASFTGPTAGGARPATADPFKSIRVPLAQEGQIPVVAPAPRRLGQTSPAMVNAGDRITSFRNSSRGSNEGENDIGRFPLNRQPQGSKNPFTRKPNGPQRILKEPEPSQYRARSLNRGGDGSPSSTNNVEDQGGLPFVSYLVGKKRVRENDTLDDNDADVRQTKRFKDQEFEDDKVSHQESYSPKTTERPSSGLSSVSGPHRQNNPEVQSSAQLRRFVQDQQGHFQSNFSPSNGMQSDHSTNASSHICGLDRLFGPGSNAYFDQHIDKYEESVRKWSECSLEEWKAGAEKISAMFTKMIDFAKAHVDNKLKAYSEFSAILEGHEETLRERKRAMELTKIKILKESGNVLN